MTLIAVPGSDALVVRTAPLGQAGRPTRAAPAKAAVAARQQSGLAKAAVALGIAGLPILRPTLAGNLGPADGAILLGVGGVLLWAGATRQLLRGAYLLPVLITMLGGV